jgi:hypothetical protein
VSDDGSAILQEALDDAKKRFSEQKTLSAELSRVCLKN